LITIGPLTPVTLIAWPVVELASAVDVTVIGSDAQSTISSRDVRFKRTFPPGFFSPASVNRGDSWILEHVEGGS